VHGHGAHLFDPDALQRHVPPREQPGEQEQEPEPAQGCHGEQLQQAVVLPGAGHDPQAAPDRRRVGDVQQDPLPVLRAAPAAGVLDLEPVVEGAQPHDLHQDGQQVLGGPGQAQPPVGALVDHGVEAGAQGGREAGRAPVREAHPADVEAPGAGFVEPAQDPARRRHRVEERDAQMAGQVVAGAARHDAQRDVDALRGELHEHAETGLDHPVPAHDHERPGAEGLRPQAVPHQCHQGAEVLGGENHGLVAAGAQQLRCPVGVLEGPAAAGTGVDRQDEGAAGRARLSHRPAAPRRRRTDR
jgi:hypothetical protein